MAFHLISFLGTNLYEPVVYYTGDKPQNPQPQDEEEFVQVALMKRFREEISNDGKVSLLVTEKACTSNWESGTYTSSPGKLWTETHKAQIAPNAPKQGLQEYLKENVPDLFDKINKVDIENAKTEAEIWKLFDDILNCIGEGDEIVFDITHSFRSIPMLAITVINYAKVMKHCTLKGIYYGAYEASTEVNEIKCAPILNLTAYNEILEWTNAANSFMQQGTAAVMKKVLAEKEKTYVGIERKKLKEVRNMVKALNTLSLALLTNRGADGEALESKKGNENKSISSAYKNLLKTRNDFLSNETRLPEMKPVYLLMDMAVKNYISFFDVEGDNAEIPAWKVGCAAVEWSIKYDMTPQGYTALEETIKTYLCERYGFPDEDTKGEKPEYYRDDILGTAMNSINAIAISTSESDPQFREKALENFWKSFKYGEKRNNEQFYEKCCFIVRDLPFGIAQAAKKVKQKRNDINHFGMESNPSTAADLQSDLETYYGDFCKATGTVPGTASLPRPTATVFVNFSNHSAANWSEEQRAAAAKYGEIIDVPFPNVSAEADESEMEELAQDCVEKILAMNPAAVMCQGEMTLTYAVVERLKNAGVTALAACSEHISEEKALPDGTTKKISSFKFCRFRAY